MERIIARVFAALALVIAAASFTRCAAAEPDYGRACLALVLYSEQNEMQPNGMLLVGATIMNRLNDPEGRYGLSICDVANQAGQFIGILNWKYPRRPQDTNPVRWAMAMNVANQIIGGQYELPGACTSANPILYFHSGAAPYWTSRYDLVCHIDGHFFYAER